MQQKPLSPDSQHIEQAINRCPLTLPPQTPLIDAIKLMSRTERINSDCVLVIVDLKPVGIFTLQDVARWVAAEVDLAATTISDAMTQHMVIQRETDLESAATLGLLHQHNTHYLVVVDDQDHLVGLVTLHRLYAWGHSDLEQPDLKQLQQATVTEKTPSDRQSAVAPLQNHDRIKTPPIHLQTNSQQTNSQQIYAQKINEMLATALKNTGDAIEITDSKGLIEYTNATWEKITGYTQTEAIGQDSMALLRSNKHDNAFYQAIADSLTAGRVWRGYLLTRCKDGSLCHQKATISPVFNSAGQIEHYIAIKRDVTGRKRIEESLRLTQFSLDHAADAAFWIRPDGKFIYVNHAACRSLNYSYAELLLMSVCDITPCSSRTDWTECWQTLKQQKSLSFESYHQTKQGTLFPVDLSMNYLEFNGREYGFVFAKDATKRRQAEEALRLRDQAITASGSGVVIVDACSPDLPIISVNPSFEQMTGYSASEALGKNCRFLQGDDQEQTAIAELRTAIHEQRECTVTLRNYRKNGTLFWNELSIAPIYNPKGDLTHFVGIQRDVSDRKTAENILRRQLAAMDAATDGIGIVNQLQEYIYLNKAHVMLLGYTDAADLLGKPWRTIYFPDEIERLEQTILPILQQTGHWRGEAIARRKDGSTFPQELSLTKIDGEGVICVCRDITERKQIDERTRASLHEKELLLREVHHRVKNNLQVISSIFSLQSQHVTDPGVLSILSESQNRIRSMALIHEKLYQSSSLARIDFSDYIQSLVRNLFSSYSISSNLIRLNLDVSDIALPIDTAIPCGLLINELVSNSLKHAFPDQRLGEISVQFLVNHQNYLDLIVQDNGVGLPQDWDIQQTNSLGLRLVRALTRQLSGKLNIQSIQGTLFQLTFPQPVERKNF